MPDPPATSLFTHYVLENPYPLGVVLLLAGVVVGWLGLRDGRLGQLRAALAPLVAGAAVIATGLAVTTSGEHGRRVVRSLAEAIEEGDLVGAMNLLSDDATAHLGSSRNVAHDRDFILAALSRLVDRYPIEENTITTLDGYSESGDAATVHVTCRTHAGGFGPNFSQWVCHVRRDDGAWRVDRVTCVSINGRAPPSSW